MMRHVNGGSETVCFFPGVDVREEQMSSDPRSRSHAVPVVKQINLVSLEYHPQKFQSRATDFDSSGRMVAMHSGSLGGGDRAFLSVVSRLTRMDSPQANAQPDPDANDTFMKESGSWVSKTLQKPLSSKKSVFHTNHHHLARVSQT